MTDESPAAPVSERRAARAANRPERKERGVWSYVAAGVSGGLLVIVLAIAVAVIIVPWLSGSTALTVLTASMEPKLPPGTLVVVKPVDASEIRIGDVVTYQPNSGVAEYITHRVVSVSRSTNGGIAFITKGDNNADPDPAPVTAPQVMGRVWYSLPWIGTLNTALGGGGKAWIVIVVAVLLFAYAGWQFIGAIFDRKPKAKSSSGATPAE